MAVNRNLVILTIGLLCTNAAFADDQKAQVNYMLHCQGCHLPGAEGSAGRVPPMNDFIGYFLHSQAGREFLIRVPGVAHAALTDAEVSELMNWLVQRFSREQLPTEFIPFTVAEVNELRRDVEQSLNNARSLILANIAADNPALASEISKNKN